MKLSGVDHVNNGGDQTILSHFSRRMDDHFEEAFFSRREPDRYARRHRWQIAEYRVSIHAPRVEADPDCGGIIGLRRVSIHALRVEGDLSAFKK